MPRISPIQQALARTALEQPNKRFEDLYGLVRDPMWLYTSLLGILDNKGADTPGVDGVTRRKLLDDDFACANLVERIAREMKDDTYRPSPVRRVYIPKPDGRQRPLGIPTIADRMVQESLRMVLEPIYESCFYPLVSYGFRPGRSCHDVVNRALTLTNASTKAWWVVEGDIKGCFDNIPHKKLLQVLAQKVADRRLLRLIRLMLAAGYVEEGKTYRPNIGTPQGGVVSPLLANIYLHEMDTAWFEKYGDPPWREKWSDGRMVRHSRPRVLGEQSVFLIRYADDFLLLTNGTKADAYSLKSEFGDILTAMGLELSQAKTAVTHVNDGFDFLGFHFQRRVTPKTGKWQMHVTPTTKNVKRLIDKVGYILTSVDEDLANKLRALNALLRGWGNYYRHVESSRTRKGLDSWLWYRVLNWVCRKHQCSKHDARELYYENHRDRKGWKNWGVRGVSLHKLSRDTSFKVHPRCKWNHPYLASSKAPSLVIQDPNPLPQEEVWDGASAQNSYAIARLQAIEEAGHRCQVCGNGPYPIPLIDAHHLYGKGTPKQDRHIVVMCRDCHKKTPSYGRNKSDESIG